ncbi:ribose import ATP-binding protein RbsA [Marinobacterium nitratireducens]|uniref:Ribose import ATP-binding protein RbsA n=1 Tax=Marinobacterium nitratireducens TaxID=518897 RepID=A0A918DWW1_9GAMM|nr:sugar ABC transporter ATP-binding protein [Marinobacterium nitratireducens]GGO86338.1 ribose import ATP-binding protein RbsA [Marinobacterium nitratireducens]
MNNLDSIENYGVHEAGTAPILSLEGITKTFPPSVVALDGVSFGVHSGEVHALLGENGAGKSTLMKVLAGIHKADAGEIYLEGRPIKMENPMDAKHQGILLIHQELSLVPEMTVAENIFLGYLPRKWPNRVDWKKLYGDADAILKRLKCNFSAKDKVSKLSIAKKHMVEIARALVFTPKIVVFDEPTASLTDTEKFVLFDVIHDLKAQGVAIVYISHRMDEIFTLSDRITVLRDGGYRGTVETKETDEDEITRLMIGRSLDTSRNIDTAQFGDKVLEVKNLSCGSLFQDISFSIRKGEVVGMYGLVGAGRTEIAETLFGLRTPTGGEVLLDGKRLDITNTTDAVRNGLALVPENRKEQGLVLGMSCRDNITMAVLQHVSSAGVLSRAQESNIYDKYAEELAIKSPSGAQKVGNLSGGNQQKVVIGKWLATHPKVLILDEPTRGIDVGSKSEIHKLIRQLAKSGYAVLVISSEMPEVLGVSDRILAMYNGRINGEFLDSEVTEDDLVRAISFEQKGQL